MSSRARTYVIEESDTCGDGDLLLVSRAGLAVKVDRYLDLGLVRLALNRRRTCSGHVLSMSTAVKEGGGSQ